MSFNEELRLLLVGAGIALVSSFLTSVFVALLNNWLSDRSKRKDKEEKAYYLTGKYTALINDSVEEAAKQFEQDAKIIKEGLPKVEEYTLY